MSRGQKHSSQQKTNKMTTLEITKIKFENNISQIEKKDVIIYKMENGFYWLQDFKTGELIDGDRRLYVVKDMAKRWNYNIKKNNK